MEICEKCDGQGIVKIDEYGDTYTIDTQEVWDDELQEFLQLDIITCPSCFGDGEIDRSEQIEDDLLDDYRKYGNN